MLEPVIATPPTDAALTASTTRPVVVGRAIGVAEALGAVALEPPHAVARIKNGAHMTRAICKAIDTV
jgi:hypothetical protein